jgi:hypothetical protein
LAVELAYAAAGLIAALALVKAMRRSVEEQTMPPTNEKLIELRGGYSVIEVKQANMTKVRRPIDCADDREAVKAFALDLLRRAEKGDLLRVDIQGIDADGEGIRWQF